MTPSIAPLNPFGKLSPTDGDEGRGDDPYSSYYQNYYTNNSSDNNSNMNGVSYEEDEDEDSDSNINNTQHMASPSIRASVKRVTRMRGSAANIESAIQAGSAQHGAKKKKKRGKKTKKSGLLHDSSVSGGGGFTHSTSSNQLNYDKLFPTSVSKGPHASSPDLNSSPQHRQQTSDDSNSGSDYSSGEESNDSNSGSDDNNRHSPTAKRSQSSIAAPLSPEDAVMDFTFDENNSDDDDEGSYNNKNNQNKGYNNNTNKNNSSNNNHVSSSRNVRFSHKDSVNLFDQNNSANHRSESPGVAAGFTLDHSDASDIDLSGDERGQNKNNRNNNVSKPSTATVTRNVKANNNAFINNNNNKNTTSKHHSVLSDDDEEVDEEVLPGSVVKTTMYTAKSKNANISQPLPSVSRRLNPLDASVEFPSRQSVDRNRDVLSAANSE
eukprot:gene29054-36038_t